MIAIHTVRTRVLGALASLGPSEVVGIVSADAPPSYEAYREFLRGEEAHSIGHFAEAIEHDRRALSLDSTYLAPLVRMAYAFINLDQCEQTDSVGRIANAKRDRLPAYEGYYLDRVLAWCRGDWNAAYFAAKRMLGVAPHSSYAKYVAARSGININHPREAVEALERLDWKKPHISGYYHDLTQALHKLGRYERELEVAELYRTRLTGSLLPVEAHVRALSALGRVDAVRRVVAASRTTLSIEQSASPTSVALTASSELTAHGHPDAGGEIARELVGWLRQQPRSEDNDFSIALALCATGELTTAHRIIKQLLGNHSEVGYHLQDVHRMNLAGVVAAMMGDRADAERISSTLAGLRDPYLRGWPIYGQAAIAAQLGEKARAVSLLQEAIRQGVAIIQVEDADWYLFPLRGYPPYEELIKPQG